VTPKTHGIMITIGERGRKARGECVGRKVQSRERGGRSSQRSVSEQKGHGTLGGPVKKVSGGWRQKEAKLRRDTDTKAN